MKNLGSMYRQALGQSPAMEAQRPVHHPLQSSSHIALAAEE
jgi:hypothetical protein